MVNLLIISKDITINSKNIREGIGHRYAGLYGSFVNHWRNDVEESKVYWYSCREYCLYEIKKKGAECVRKTFMPFAVFKSFKEASKSSSPRLIVIIGYPHGLYKGFSKSVYVFTLMVLRVLNLLKFTLLLVDDFDPPLETAVAFEYTPSFLTRVLYYTLDVFTLKKNFIITTTRSYKIHLSRKYKLQQRNVFVIPNGSLLANFVSAVPPKSTGPLTVLYAGSLLPAKDIHRLINCIRNLRMKNCDLKLVLTGRKLMNIDGFSWLEYANPDNWLFWVKKYLKTADICVVPYPRRFHWNYTSLAKLFDYMAGGKPVVAMNLTETTKVIQGHNCGLIANDWAEFESQVQRLYENRQLAKALGMNGRKAAENEYNYGQLSRKLEKIVFSCLRLYTSVDEHL